MSTLQLLHPDDAPAGQRFMDGHLPLLLARAAHLATTHFERALRDFGEEEFTWRVLAALYDFGDETISRLAGACRLQQPTASKLLDRLCARGLVERRSDARDRRVVRVRLTPAGRDLAGRLVAAARAHEEQVLALLTAEDAAALRRHLVALVDGLPAATR